MSKAVVDGKKSVESIPERRPNAETRKKMREDAKTAPALAPELPGGKLKYPVWRCAVCGYLAARPEPPGICPICKVGKERFERFL